MKFTATFPAYAGQYAGVHYFETKKSRATFIARAIARGVDVKAVVYGNSAA